VALLVGWGRGKTIDEGSILGGVLLPGSVSDKVAGAYRKHLFGNATLQDLPAEPRFVLNATNVQSGALWRFSRPFMAPYRVGVVRNMTSGFRSPRWRRATKRRRACRTGGHGR
jgi:hypothetical protein